MKKKQRINGFVYFRFIFPIIISIAMLGIMFIPCYRFKTAGGLNKAISLGTVMSNGWDTVRGYLFGGGETEKVVSDFAWTLLLIIIVLVVLFTIGFAFAVYSCIRMFSYVYNNDRDSKEHILFITIIPNRIFACAYYALMLPVFALPIFLPLLYEKFLYEHIELFYAPFDMLWIAVGLYAVTVAVVIISGYFEKKSGIDVFAKREAPVVSFEANEEIPFKKHNDEDIYEQMNEEAKQEQRERILRLLNKIKEEDEQ